MGGHISNEVKVVLSVITTKLNYNKDTKFKSLGFELNSHIEKVSFSIMTITKF